MKRLDEICALLSFILVTVVLLAAPWLFGAWEMLWFWPCTVLVFAATAGFAVRLILSLGIGTGSLYLLRPALTAVLCYLPFLGYGLVRTVTADVFMDAERSFLRHLTPVLLGSVLVFGATSRQLRILVLLLLGNFALLGLYGIANNFLTGNTKVLWMDGFPQYQLDYHRATGSYYCPDHFAGLMELGLALALGVLLARESRPRLRVSALALAGITVTGVLLSKSRGGGLALLVMACVALVVGLVQWRPALRWRIRGGALLLAVGAGMLLLGTGHRYVQRFREYPWRQLQYSDRCQMAAAALRAWRTAPVLGIEPGMHQNLWPHFAATADGDRATGRWPSMPNNDYHSYEVHSDWVQLLEEYGALGCALFLMAAGGVGHLLLRGWRRERGEQRAEAWSGPCRRDFAVLLAAILAVAAMTFHSLGDFNLQIPATTWLLAALVAIPAARVSRERHERRRRAAQGSES